MSHATDCNGFACELGNRQRSPIPIRRWHANIEKHRIASGPSSFHLEVVENKKVGVVLQDHGRSPAAECNKEHAYNTTALATHVLALRNRLFDEAAIAASGTRTAAPVSRPVRSWSKAALHNRAPLSYNLERDRHQVSYRAAKIITASISTGGADRYRPPRHLTGLRKLVPGYPPDSASMDLARRRTLSPWSRSSSAARSTPSPVRRCAARGSQSDRRTTEAWQPRHHSCQGSQSSRQPRRR